MQKTRAVSSFVSPTPHKGPLLRQWTAKDANEEKTLRRSGRSHHGRHLADWANQASPSARRKGRESRRQRHPARGGYRFSRPPTHPARKCNLRLQRESACSVTGANRGGDHSRTAHDRYTRTRPLHDRLRHPLGRAKSSGKVRTQHLHTVRFQATVTDCRPSTKSRC